MTNCNAGCSLNMKDKTYDILIGQLRTEIRKLTENTNAHFLLHDSKIAELCNFIKLNLSNELQEMLDVMRSTGELDKLITEIVLHDLQIVKDHTVIPVLHSETGVVNDMFPYGHIKRYGAVCDGETDDSACVQLAADNAVANGFPLLADEGSCLINSAVSFRYIALVDFKADIVGVGSVTVGHSSANAIGINVKLSTVPELIVLGTKNSLISFKRCQILTITADGDDSTASSTAYTTFKGAYCKSITLTSKGKAIGWINENIFDIKRVEEISISGNYDHNNNHFLHCNLERGIVKLERARNNYISARCEGGITVSSSDDSQANFIEKEYYYRHYFAEDVQEDGQGTVQFFPVNKIQTERELMRIDASNKHFPVGSVFFNENGTFYGATYTTVFKSNLIPIDRTFAIKMKCSHAAMRVQLNFYDAYKNRITEPVNNFADGRLGYIGSEDWSYRATANIAEDAVIIYPGDAKYVEYSGIFGNEAESKNLEYIKVKLLKYTNTDINIVNTIKNDIYTAVPTKGYWEVGQMLIGKNPRAGAYIGIICVEAGTPGVWKNFAQIME